MTPDSPNALSDSRENDSGLSRDSLPGAAGTYWENRSLLFTPATSPAMHSAHHVNLHICARGKKLVDGDVLTHQFSLNGMVGRAIAEQQ